MGELKPPLTYAELHHAIEARDLYGGVKGAAHALGWTEQKVQHRINVAREEGMCEPAQERATKRPSSDFGYKRHLFIPDTQIRPGVPTDHIAWIAQAIVDYKPDVIVVAGDWFDFPSLNSHEEPGSEALEGRRFKDDVDAGNLAFMQLCQPLEVELARSNRWAPRLEFLEGNHEHRADRVAQADPKWLGHVGSHHCQVRGFKWNKFLEVVEIDGISYSHFFQNPHSKHPIGGTALNRLNKIGSTFVQGHVQGFDYGTKVTATGRMLHGVVSGSCYLHTEDYRGPQGSKHFNGIQIFNKVKGGDLCIMPLTTKYLCRRYESMRLAEYMRLRYPNGNWDHLED